MNGRGSLHGLNCPSCGGTIPVSEGQAIAQCPYCDMRSLVRGERGVWRYQVPQRIDHDRAVDEMHRFLLGERAIAGDAVRCARLEEAFVVYLPLWMVRAHVLGWVFGKIHVSSGKRGYYETREVKVAEEMIWNKAACDMGEFGIEDVSLEGKILEPFNAEDLHENGLVFEPVGSIADAKTAAEDDFDTRVYELSRMAQVEQAFVRFVHQQLGLVYYPLWVLRYLYRGRTFQVVVDGYSGDVLYGRAPGRTLFRAAMLVGYMALGAFVAVDVSAFFLVGVLEQGINSLEEAMALIWPIGFTGLGLLIMGAAYNAIRYGGQLEYGVPRTRSRRIAWQWESGVTRAREVEE